MQPATPVLRLSRGSPHELNGGAIRPQGHCLRLSLHRKVGEGVRRWPLACSGESYAEAAEEQPILAAMGTISR